jgi:hypothetical protein
MFNRPVTPLDADVQAKREAIRNASTEDEFIDALGCGYLGEAGYYASVIWRSLNDCFPGRQPIWIGEDEDPPRNRPYFRRTEK